MSIDSLSYNNEPRLNPDREEQRQATIPENIEPESDIHNPNKRRGFTGRQKIGAGVLALATAVTGGIAISNALTGHNKRPAATAAANPGEHQSSFEKDPRKWNRDNVPLEWNGKTYVGVDKLAEVMELTTKKDPTIQGATEDLVQTRNEVLNWGNSPDIQKASQGFVSEDGTSTGAAGVANFVITAYREALTNTGQSVNVDNWISGIPVYKAYIDHYYQASLKHLNAQPYHLEESIDTSKTPDGTGITVGGDSSVMISLKTVDNYDAAGFTKADDSSYGKMDGSDSWNVVFQTQNGVRKVVNIETKNS